MPSEGGGSQRGDRAAEEPVLTFAGVTVRYGRVTALDGLSFSARPGSTGLLGPNGAGKTTILRVILGLVVPEAGRVRAAGCDPALRDGRMAVRRHVGYMPEGDCLIPGMNAVDHVATLGRLSGLGPADALSRAHDVLDATGFHESRYRDAIHCSTGMKQRLKLAQALVHDPSLLLLDEPTNGLDPHGRVRMLDTIEELALVHGKHILFCSHILPDVEHVCRDVVVISRGRSAGGGAVREMTRGDAAHVLATVAGDRREFTAAAAALGLSPEAALAEGPVRLRLPPGMTDLDTVFEAAHRAGATLEAATSAASTLEDVFLAVLAETEEGTR